MTFLYNFLVSHVAPVTIKELISHCSKNSDTHFDKTEGKLSH